MIFKNHNGWTNNGVYPCCIITIVLPLNNRTMQTSHSPHNDKPQPKALYVPGPFVAPIKALIDAYRAGNNLALSSALEQLGQAIREAEPNPRLNKSKPAPKSKTKSKPLKKVVAEAVQEQKAVSRAQKVMATKLPAEADPAIDLVSRLNRDYPAIAERYAMGEFKTIKEAAVAAGMIVEPSPPPGKKTRY
ncbi:MAG: hypothetical protein KDJ31_12605 [Candidatus Competibacteraceae bacterium]|nr:hypothetical protein [Candidatus Competibacteraceae bacterium]